MTSNQTEALFGSTEYTLKEVNLLIVVGVIPPDFLDFAPDGGIEIDHFITSFMESFPRKDLGDNWIEVFRNSILQACQLIKYETVPPEGVRVSDDRDVSALFFNTAKLSSRLNMKNSKLEKLLHWVMEENPDVQPFVMHDQAEGYLVSSFLVNQLDKTGLRLDKFLKKIVSGEIKLGVK
ncbi:hypothetical protein ACFL2Q_05935 [Thermodesulfobacteriota bacterium]